MKASNCVAGLVISLAGATPRQAMGLIESDPSLKARFQGSLWVAPQDGNRALDSIREWNTHADITKLHLMYDKWTWPVPDANATPTFYFLNNGRVVDAVQGWPGPEQKDA